MERTIKIYQANIEKADYIFRDWECAQRHGFTFNDYEEIYEFTMDINPSKNINVYLDDIFTMFNVHRPEDFKGHSLSVSDIIMIKGNGGLTLYYVDDFGFKKLSPEEWHTEKGLKKYE